MLTPGSNLLLSADLYEVQILCLELGGSTLVAAGFRASIAQRLFRSSVWARPKMKACETPERVADEETKKPVKGKMCRGKSTYELALNS